MSCHRIGPVHRELTPYYLPSADDFEQLWKSGTFFLDASSLLNLYRYPKQASSDVFGVLENIGPRLVVPFHAALEFERNRLSVIAEQKKRFREVRDAVMNAVGGLRKQLDGLQLRKRHSAISVDEFLMRLEREADSFATELGKLEAQQADVQANDSLRERLRKLLFGKVGDPPRDQPLLDQIYAHGGARYARGTPPGYLDAAKDDGKGPFEYGGLLYRREFGDLIVWEQIIAAASAHQLKAVVFVTDDEKEDWWWTVESQGRKRLGPRPELVEEIRRRAGVEIFFIYNSEQLVNRATQYLKVVVQSESADQIREVKQAVQARLRSEIAYAAAEEAVAMWVAEQHPDASILYNARGFPDLVAANQDGRRVGYEIAFGRTSNAIVFKVRDVLYRAEKQQTQNDRVDRLWIVFVGAELRDVERARDFLHRHSHSDSSLEIGIVSGIVVERDGEPPRFIVQAVVEA
jgi:hypothetical protein